MKSKWDIKKIPKPEVLDLREDHKMLFGNAQKTRKYSDLFKIKLETWIRENIVSVY